MLRTTLDIRVDGFVTLSLRVCNVGAAAESVAFPSAQRYDFEISAAAGPSLWRWSAEQMFAQVATSAVLGAGECWTFVERWSPSARGSLRARGLLASSSHPAESIVPFDLA